MVSFWDLPPEILCHILALCDPGVHSHCGNCVAPVQLYVFFETLPTRYRNTNTVQYILNNYFSPIPEKGLQCTGTDLGKYCARESFQKIWWVDYYRWYAVCFSLGEPRSPRAINDCDNLTLRDGFIKGLYQITGYVADTQKRVDAFLDMHPDTCKDIRNHIMYAVLTKWFLDADNDIIDNEHAQRIVRAMHFCLKIYPELRSNFKYDMRKLTPFRDYMMPAEKTLLCHHIPLDTAHAFLNVIKDVCELDTLSEFIEATNMCTYASCVSHSTCMTLLEMFPCVEPYDCDSRIDPFLVIARDMNESKVVKLLQQSPESCRLTRVLVYAHDNLIWKAFRYCGYFSPFYTMIPDDENLTDSEINDIIRDDIIVPILRHDSSYTDRVLADLLEDLVRDKFAVLNCEHTHIGLRVIMQQIKDHEIRAHIMQQLASLETNTATMLYADETAFSNWRYCKHKNGDLDDILDEWASISNTTREHVKEILGGINSFVIPSEDDQSLNQFLYRKYQTETYNTHPLLIYLRSLK